jgi:hypothetical protein
LPTKLWWVVLNEDGGAIVKAGRLIAPGPDGDRDDSLFERLPNVVARADGKFSLVYLTRLAPHSAWELRSSTFEIDPRTALPRTLAEAGSILLAKDLRADPLIVSATGDSVYAVDSSGRIVEHSIPR